MKNDLIKLIAMDLDGTLTQHKSKLEAPIRDVLDKLRETRKLVLVGAGSCQRIWEQTKHYPIDIIGNYGMQLAKATNVDLNLINDLSAPCDCDDVTERIAMLRKYMGYEEYIGDTVEFHLSGMITFPLLGTKAALADKLRFDPSREKRRRMLDKVREVFHEYTVFIGGTSSYDIVPPPYNKLYALASYIKTLGLQRENVIYIGDDYGAGGNDEHLYWSDIRFLQIDDYRKFPEIVDFLLK